MAELFKGPPMAAFTNPRNLQDRHANPMTQCPMAALQRVQTPDACCASTALTWTVLKAPLRVVPTNYWAIRLAAQTTTSISSVARFVLNNTFGKQLNSAEELTTTA